MRASCLALFSFLLFFLFIFLPSRWHCESRLDTFAGEGCWEEWLPPCRAMALDSFLLWPWHLSSLLSLQRPGWSWYDTSCLCVRVPPPSNLSSHPLLFLLCPLPSLHFPCGILFFFSKSKEFLFIVSCEIFVQTKEARPCLRTLPSCFSSCWNALPQIPIFYLSQGMWSFLLKNVFF